MPTKLERMRELGRHLTLVEQAQGEMQQLDHLATLKDKILPMVDGLERLNSRCAILGVKVDRAARRSLVDKLAELSAQVVRDPSQVGQGSEFNNFKDALGDYNRALGEVADQEWAARREAALTATSKGMLPFWETIPELREDALEVTELLSAIEAKSRPEQDPSRLKLFLENCESIQERAERLNAFEAPAEVRSFLKAARTGSGAPWESLTDEVRDWLGEHGLLNTLRVRLG